MASRLSPITHRRRQLPLHEAPAGSCGAPCRRDLKRKLVEVEVIWTYHLLEDGERRGVAADLLSRVAPEARARADPPAAAAALLCLLCLLCLLSSVLALLALLE